jgi:hypothetical protein
MYKCSTSDSPVHSFILMHAFTVQIVLRKKTASEPALRAECQMRQTFRFAP